MGEDSGDVKGGGIAYCLRTTTKTGTRARLPLGTGIDFKTATRKASELSVRCPSGERDLRQALEADQWAVPVADVTSDDLLAVVALPVEHGHRTGRAATFTGKTKIGVRTLEGGESFSPATPSPKPRKTHRH
ncbi:MAG TPA: hypothetical protein VIM92_06715 [Rhodanobacteraceae bacterium]